MDVIKQLDTALIRLIGYSAATPKTVKLAGDDGVEFAVDFTAVDSMSCSLAELRVDVPALAAAGFDALKEWAEELCKRVTYLLENIGPLEYDPDAASVLIRSTPPAKRGGSTKYYEIMLQSESAGRFTLRRYEAEQGTPGRKPVDLHVTHEVLRKLVADLIDTIPDAQ